MFYEKGHSFEAMEKLRLQRYAACLRDQRIECQTAPQFFQPRRSPGYWLRKQIAVFTVFLIMNTRPAILGKE